jgi:D-alanyl-D-alanine carboxypeptidase/D-alanyl-D-alanine-endopeptidase (penicillin-binding protein 4)
VLVRGLFSNWLGACEPSIPVSAGGRRNACARLEEVFLNVWTILVLLGIFQREGQDVVKTRGVKRLFTVWVAFCACFIFTVCARGQNHSKPEKCCTVPAEAVPQAGEVTAAAIQRFLDRVGKILDAEQPAKGEWGILVEDAKTGRVLFAQNPDRYFVPASNMKLFTTALALSTLGPDYRFRTTVEAKGAVSSNGRLEGALFLVGRGDPNLSNRKFPFDTKEEFDGPPEKVIAELANQVVASGMKDIAGDIVGDDSYFPRERYPNGWEIDDMVWEFGAAVSAIVVNDNSVVLTLSPGENTGASVQSELAPMTADFRVNNLVTTSAVGVKPDLTLKREVGSNMVTVLGTLPAKSKPRKLLLAVQEPALHAAQMLKRILEEKGIVVRGVARAESNAHDSALSAGRTVLATHVSVPLSDAVKLVNKISQNLHTELLLRTSVHETCMNALVGAASLECLDLTPEKTFEFVQEFYAKAGIATGDVVQTDGSGLSRHDLATPRAFVALLSYAMKQNWFPAFYDSLPVAGIDGTLEDRLKNSVAASRIHAKSGSLEHVRTRSGYAELPNGRRLIFSFMSNNMGSKGHEATEALDALSAAMIEEFGAEPAGCCKSKE